MSPETYKDKPIDSTFKPAHSTKFSLPFPSWSILRLPSPGPQGTQRRARRSRIRTLLTLLAVACLFITPLYFIYRPPSFVISFFQSHWPDVLFSVDTDEKVIALTIDDAPSQHTDELRQILKEHEAHATFFVIGSQVGGKEQALVDLVKDGHELGNHAMRDEPSRDLPTAELVSQIEAVDRLISAAYEAEPGLRRPAAKYFRPGSGLFSSAMRKAVRDMGYQMVLGGIYPHDPQIEMPTLNSWHILSMLQPGGIIICHDRREWTAPMLRQVLPEMKRRGWTVLSVGEMVKRVNEPKAATAGYDTTGATDAIDDLLASGKSGSGKAGSGTTGQATDRKTGKALVDGSGRELVEDLRKEGDEGGAALEEEREG